ncbi:MAG: hypothetical protein R3326_06290 [Gemmatimonadota bacterium]|nr:hypothetical protein [Gemmatimonadota bacterium]
MKIRGSHLLTALVVGALALAACEGAGEEDEELTVEQDTVVEDTVGWDVGTEDEDDGDFEAEAREAGEELEEGVEESVEAVGAGTEELGEEIQESVEDEPEDESP